MNSTNAKEPRLDIALLSVKLSLFPLALSHMTPNGAQGLSNMFKGTFLFHVSAEQKMQRQLCYRKRKGNVKKLKLKETRDEDRNLYGLAVVPLTPGSAEVVNILQKCQPHSALVIRC